MKPMVLTAETASQCLLGWILFALVLGGMLYGARDAVVGEPVQPIAEGITNE